MTQWKFLCTRWQVIIIGLWSNDFMGVRIQFLIHTLWIVLLVPWEPLSLLVVSLTLVNGSHHWPVIKQLSSMFHFNMSIHVLDFVLWLSRVGAQDPGLISQKLRLWGEMIHSWLYTWFFRQMAVPIPWIYFIWSLSRMVASILRIHAHDLFLDG